MSEEELGGYPLERGQPEYNLVHEISAMSFSGYVIPPEWFDHLQYKSGKPHMNAIMILADTIYWYRPKRVEDPDTGKVIAYRKRFKGDKLQRSYSQYMTRFNMTKKQARDAVQYLEDEGYITKELRSVTLENGTRLVNVMYIEPVIERIKRITYPHYKDVSYALQGIPYALQGNTLWPTGHTNTEITTEITTEAHGGDVTSVNQDALNALLSIGVSPDQAVKWATTCDPDWVIGWCEYAKSAGGITNPPGLVVAMLRDGVPPPPRIEPEPEPVYVPPPSAEPLSPMHIPGTDLDARDVWSRVLEELRMQMTRATFDTWLGGSQVVQVSDQRMTVQVRDAYAIEWLRTRWIKPIQRTLRGILGRDDLQVEFVTRADDDAGET